MLRLIEEEAMKDKTGKVIAKLPVDVTSFLLNEKRSNISEVEQRHNVELIIVPNPNLETPHFTVERVRDDDKETVNKPSYDHVPLEEPEINLERKAASSIEQPAVKAIHSTVAPIPSAKDINKKNSQPGMFKRLFAWMFGQQQEPAAKQAVQKNSAQRPRPKTQGQQRNNNRNHPNNRRRNQNNRRNNNRASGPAGNRSGNQRRSTDQARKT